MDFLAQFKNEMINHGLASDAQIIPDGQLHRFHVEGDASQSLNGWYVVHTNNIPSGAYGCWKRNISHTWCSKSQTEMSVNEVAAHNEFIKVAKEKRNIEKVKIQIKAKEDARRTWDQSKRACDEHAYLKAKAVKSYGLRLSDDDRLIVPLFDTTKQLHSLQFIPSVGIKKFLFGGKVAGCYFPIGKPELKIFIAEGYATAATIFACTNCATVCAFNCDNLIPVAKVLRQKFPAIDIILAADNDQWPNKEGIIDNRGLIKARKAAKLIDADVIFPDFSRLDVTNKPTDFNDLMLLAGTEEVRRQLSQSLKDEWPEPEVIKNELLPVEILTPDIIPESFRDFVTDVAERMQCPIDFVAITLLVVVSATIGAGCGIRPKQHDNWVVIPNLWGCIVGRPGMMKTPAVSEVMKFLEILEVEAKKTQDENFKNYTTEFAIYTAKKEAIKSQMVQSQKAIIKNGATSDGVSPEYLKNLLNDLTEPSKPVWRRFKTNDSTIEKLHELSSENPRGLLVYRDELMGWLKTFDKAGHESDRAFFLEAWNGNGSMTSDRISRGTTRAENLCFSVFGTTQPDKLLRYLYGAVHGENDGLIQRFQLLVYPDEPAVWQRIDRIPNHKASDRVAKIIKNLADMDFAKHVAVQATDERFSYFNFDTEAQNSFYEWWEDLERNKLKSDAHPILIEHLAKYRKLMPALALLFHLIDTADGNTSVAVTKENTVRAAAWVDYLESHASRVYAIVTDIDMKAASLLSEKLSQGKLKDGFTVRDIYRQNWSILNNKPIAQAACDELLAAGWLREKVIEPAFGQKRTVTYLINPRIKGEFIHG